MEFIMLFLSLLVWPTVSRRIFSVVHNVMKVGQHWSNGF